MKNFKTLISSLALVTTTSLFAYDGSSSYSLALVDMSMDYKEYNTAGTLIDSEKSKFTDIAGVEMAYAYGFGCKGDECTKIDFNILRVVGNSDYVGSPLGSNLPYGSTVSSTLNTITDISLSSKVYVSVTPSTQVIYGVGLGYRYWERELSTTQKEIYSWFSLRPVLGVEYAISKNLSISALAEYHYAIKPTMSASNVSSDFTLGSTNIIEMKIPVEYQVSNKLGFFSEFVFSKQTIRESNHITQGINTFYEPDSTAYNNYVKIGMRYKY